MGETSQKNKKEGETAVNYFVWNKQLDYRRGYLEHVICTQRGIQLDAQSIYGACFSRVVDTLEEQTVFHRMTCVLPFDTARVSFSFYATDARSICFVHQGQRQECDISTFLQYNHLTIEEKKNILSPLLQKTCTNATDTLLHEVQGRYFWFCVEIYATQVGMGGVETIICYFPKETWLSFLPSIYQKNTESATFLERYLSIFQSISNDFEREFLQSVSQLDADAVSIDGLRWLASFLSLQDLYLWNETQLRALVKYAPIFYRKRGTRTALSELLHIFTGEQPFIIEEFETRTYRTYSDKKQYLKQLYGENEYIVFVLLKEQYLYNHKDREVLQRLVQAVIPAYMEVKLIPLRPKLYLGEYVYLGINSVLGAYQPLQLDGISMVSFSTIG